MAKYQHFYLVEIQYLGMRYHGWQIQGNLKTIQLMLTKTLNYIGLTNCKVLPAGRTDALVSAGSGHFELFSMTAISQADFLLEMNQNLPADMSLTSIKSVDKDFNVIQDVVEKTYRYYFYFGKQKYPFSASLLGFFGKMLNVEAMIKAAGLFEGTHDFTAFCKDVTPETRKIRTINKAIIKPNDALQANFFPPKSYVFEVKGKGFGRHQIRLMMGALVQIGEGILTEEMLLKMLHGQEVALAKFLAPGSGLMVHEVRY